MVSETTNRLDDFLLAVNQRLSGVRSTPAMPTQRRVIDTTESKAQLVDVDDD
jgi:hypothetical protein